MYSQAERKTLWILFNWLQEPAGLDLRTLCSLWDISEFSRERFNENYQSKRKVTNFLICAKTHILTDTDKSMYLQAELKTVWILFNWLQEPAGLDLRTLFSLWDISEFSRDRFKENYQS